MECVAECEMFVAEKNFEVCEVCVGVCVGVCEKCEWKGRVCDAVVKMAFEMKMA
jgi:hypothetical protein